jgi:hypothetical protein
VAAGSDIVICCCAALPRGPSARGWRSSSLRPRISRRGISRTCCQGGQNDRLEAERRACVLVAAATVKATATVTATAAVMQTAEVTS